jgi:hypothetical protein
LAIETRNGKTFYYRHSRTDGRVVKTFIGSGPKAMEAAEVDRQQRQERATADEAERKVLDGIREVDALVAESSQVFDVALTAALLKVGYHRRRGEWRKIRGHGSQTAVEIGSRT